MSALSGSPYLNTLIFGILRTLFAALVSAADYGIPRFGRRELHGGAAAAIVAICGLLVAAILSGHGGEFAEEIRGGALVASCMSSLLWLAAYLYSAELYPTPVRNLANAYCSSWARLGGIVAPQILYLVCFTPPFFFPRGCGCAMVAVGADDAVGRGYVPAVRGAGAGGRGGGGVGAAGDEGGADA